MSFRTTVTLAAGSGRRHLAVNQNWKTGRWCLQWATATAYGGHRFDPALPGDYATKREATEAKRAIVNGGV